MLFHELAITVVAFWLQVAFEQIRTSDIEEEHDRQPYDLSISFELCLSKKLFFIVWSWERNWFSDYTVYDIENIDKLPGDGIGEVVPLLLVPLVHALASDKGIQMGTEQQLLTTHTDVFVAHRVPLVHESNNEQATCGAQSVAFVDVRKL